MGHHRHNQGKPLLNLAVQMEIWSKQRVEFTKWNPPRIIMIKSCVT